ncbi:MAG: hypothetical protein WD894_05660 [Pirellulales bacterium]
MNSELVVVVPERGEEAVKRRGANVDFVGPGVDVEPAGMLTQT